MEVGMVVQVLTPGVQHRDDADLGAEVLGISRNGSQRLGRRPEQDGIDRGFVLERDLGDGRRYREDDMEVRYWQQLGLPGGEPVGARLPLAFRAMAVSAGVVGAADEPARCADLGMTTQFRRSAQLDRAHHAPLDAPEMPIVGVTIGVAIAAEDIRQLQARHGAAGSGGRHHLQRQAVEWTLRLPDEPARYPGITVIPGYRAGSS